MFERPSQISGLNWSHLATKFGRVLLAGVPSGGTLIDYSTGQTGAFTTGMTLDNTVPALGPALKTDHSVNSILFSNRASYSSAGVTVAGIFQLNTLSANDVAFIRSSTNVGSGQWKFFCQTAGSLVLRQLAVASVGSGIAVPLGVPVFIVATYIGGTSTPFAYVVRRLDNGAITVATGTATFSAPAAQTNLLYGCNFSNPNLDGWCSNIAVLEQGIPLAAALAWADDPWGLFAPAPLLLLRRRVNAASGTVYTVTALASTSPIARLVRQTGKLANDNTSPVASLIRQTGKPIARTTSPVATLVRQAGKPLQGSSSPLATLASIKTKLQNALATTSPIAALTRQAGKLISASTSPVASDVRQTGKSFAASSTALATLNAIKTKLQSALAQTSPVASLSRQTGKIVQGSTSPVANVARQIAKAALASTAAVASLVRQAGKLIKASTSALATLGAIKTRTQSAQASTTPLATLSRQTAKLVQATTTPLGILSRLTSKALSAASSVLASLSYIVHSAFSLSGVHFTNETLTSPMLTSETMTAPTLSNETFE